MRSWILGAALAPLALSPPAPALAQSDARSSPGARAAGTAVDTAIDTVTVTRSARGMEAARIEVDATPGGATLVDLSELEQRNVASLADALRYVPGVWAVSDTGNDSMFFSSRGSNLDATDWDMNGIRIFQDGLPVTTADGNNHNRVVDPLAARYATMIRGANALEYGASTLGGAVNFVTPTARDGGANAVSLRAGSHGQRLARLSYGFTQESGFDALVTIEGKRWEGYRAHNDQRRSGLYANAGWQVGERWTTRFYATALDNDQELPGSLTRAELESAPERPNAAAVDGDYQLDVTTRRLANRTTWRIDANRTLDFGLSLEAQSLYHPIVWVAVDSDGPLGAAPPTELFSLLIDTDHRDVGAMLRYGQSIGRHDFTLGLNYGRNDVKGGHYRNLAGQRNGLTAVIRNAAATAELFAVDRWHAADRTTLVVAAQAVVAERDTRSTAVATGVASNPRARYDAINPRIGFVHDAGADTRVYGNVSRLFEPPTNFELEDNVAGGDATLEPMRGTVVEIGARGEHERQGASFGWDVSLYRAEIDDEILSVEDPAAPGTSLVTNVDATLHAGVEALLHGRLEISGGRGTLEPLVSLTLNDFRFADDAVYGDDELPAAPELFVRGEVMYRAASGRFFVGPTFDRVGARWADFANTYRVPSHVVYGLRAGWARGKWQAFAELRNVTDERYAVSHAVRNVARPQDAILNPGEPRSAYFGVSLALR